MFRFTTLQPSEIAGTIKLSKKISGLGTYEDIYGRKWDVNAIIGNIVCAVPLENLHPYYKDTSSFNNYGLVHQEWLPYKVEIVEDNKIEKESQKE
ncbi:MAG: hypothetical protein ACOCP4_00745 [Candidatus Woesearchaeota archaeon]